MGSTFVDFNDLIPSLLRTPQLSELTLQGNFDLHFQSYFFDASVIKYLVHKTEPGAQLN